MVASSPDSQRNGRQKCYKWRRRGGRGVGEREGGSVIEKVVAVDKVILFKLCSALTPPNEALCQSQSSTQLRFFSILESKKFMVAHKRCLDESRARSCPLRPVQPKEPWTRALAILASSLWCLSVLSASCECALGNELAVVPSCGVMSSDECVETRHCNDVSSH